MICLPASPLIFTTLFSYLTNLPCTKKTPLCQLSFFCSEVAIIISAFHRLLCTIIWIHMQIQKDTHLGYKAACILGFLYNIL